MKVSCNMSACKFLLDRLALLAFDACCLNSFLIRACCIERQIALPSLENEVMFSMWQPLSRQRGVPKLRSILNYFASVGNHRGRDERIDSSE